MKKLRKNKKFRTIFCSINVVLGFVGFSLANWFLTPATPVEETLFTVVQLGSLLLFMVCLTGLYFQSFKASSEDENNNTEDVK